MYQIDSGNGGSRYVRGDHDPSEFKWEDLLTREEFLTLLKRNSKIKKMCAWMSREALRERFVLQNDHRVRGTKFGKPFTFNNQIEWLEWIKFFEEIQRAITWSRLFGFSITVGFNDNESIENTTRYPGTIMPYLRDLPEGYTSCMAFHPATAGVGFEVHEAHPITGKPLVFKVSMSGAKATHVEFYVDAARVVEFNAPKLTGEYWGISEVDGLAKIALVQEQMLKATMKRLQLMGGGLLICSASNETEANAVEDSIGDQFTYLHKLYTSDDVEKAIRVFVPDIKSAQFAEIWEITQDEIATSMNQSKKLLVGDSQGAISSATEDKNISYSEIYQIQQHYRQTIEHVLWMLGVKDTRFEWIDPMVSDTDEQQQQQSTPESSGNGIGTEGNTKSPKSPTKPADAPA